MELDLDRVIRIVRRWGIWLLVFTIFGVLSGALLSFTRPVEYASTSTLLLSPVGGAEPRFGYDVNQALQSQTEIYRYYAGTTPFLSEAAALLGLDPSTGVQQLQAVTSTVSSQAVSTIDITVTDTDAGRTTLWANTIAQQLIAYIGRQEAQTTGSGGNWVTLTNPEPASVPGAPVSPNRPLWGVLGGMFGFLVAASGILLIDRLRATMPAINRRPAALPVLAVLDTIRSQGSGGAGLLVDPTADSEVVRGVNQLRSAVQILTATQGIRTLAISSLRPGEGKSTVAANLAVALAEAGDRVILVDGNLVAPRLGEAFGGRTARGLTSLMADPDLDLADVVTSTNWANLMFVPAGPRVEDGEIDRAAFRRTIAGIVPHADLVIFEVASLTGTAEPLRLGTHADGMLLVVGGERTRIEALRGISREKSVTSGNVVGVVIDRGAGSVLAPLPPHAPAGLTLVASHQHQTLPIPADPTPRLQPALATHAQANGMVRTQRAVPVADPDAPVSPTHSASGTRPEATA